MFYQSGLLLLLLDLSVICGHNAQDDETYFEVQMTQENSTAFEDTDDIYNDVVTLSEAYKGTFDDYEDFQDQGSSNRYIYCDEMLLKQFGEVFCWAFFNDSMSAIAKEKWCNMEMVVRSYSRLTECMESASKELKCYYPNPVVEQLFVKIHHQYFSSCNNEEDLSDAPAEVVLIATLLPILLIPFIVYIVVWKSSLKD